MTTPRSDNPDHGFHFPGVFEITAMGPAGAGLEERIPQVLEGIGLTVLRETVAARNSSGGRFVSIRLSFQAEDRARYEAAHAALRAEPDVKWTL
jgi:putative lipoic acid-binding regulatory protein